MLLHADTGDGIVLACLPMLLHADTGDGGNSTYSVARALAAPHLQLHVPARLAGSMSAPTQPMHHTQDQEQRQQGPRGQGVKAQVQGLGGQPTGPPISAGMGPGGTASLTLPRADLLLIGGDLAYPNPTSATYEHRLLRPFQDALAVSITKCPCSFEH